MLPEFLLWFITFFVSAWTGVMYGHSHLFAEAVLAQRPTWLAISLALVAVLVAQVKWLRHLRFASSGFRSVVPGHEGMCFHYFGPDGFVQKGKHLFGPLYYVKNGETFLGSLVNGQIHPWLPRCIAVERYGSGLGVATPA